MSVHQDEIHLSTRDHGEMHDLTESVQAIVRDSGHEKGLVNVSCIGSTGAVGTIEFEPGLQRDLPEMLDKLFPPGRDYGHEQMWHDGNGHSHLQATTLGPSITLPVRDRSVALGTWQQIFFLECDNKPHQRTLVVTVMGE